MEYISKNIKNQRQQYFKYYTMLFLLAAMLVFSWYFLTGTSFIWKKDGWTQHYKLPLHNIYTYTKKGQT